MVVSVKPSQSGARALAALETIAAHQPISVLALAKLLDEDKSATQRAVATLAESGWIRLAAGSTARWELTPHIFTVCHKTFNKSGGYERTRGLLEILRWQTEETVHLTLRDDRRLVVVDALEGKHMLRMVPAVGVVVPLRGSAIWRAVLAYMDTAEQVYMIGEEPDQTQLAKLAETRLRGYAICDGGNGEGVTSLAAPIFELNGTPVGAVGVSGPTDKIVPGLDRIGDLVARTARSLSRGAPALAGHI
jgi:IclR family acetate operon transcriptional repressor